MSIALKDAERHKELLYENFLVQWRKDLDELIYLVDNDLTTKEDCYQRLDDLEQRVEALEDAINP